jgi:adenylate cyclase class 2
MAANNQEIEAKFYVTGLDGIKARLRDLGARLTQERILETNIRFDLPDARLRSEGRVLRLRRDTEARLTYKGGSQNKQGVLSRTEIEFTVGDFDKAKLFLEALGYQELLRYDKFREVYELDDCHIMLDELPYGYFVEIEGERVEDIQKVTEKLHLKWEAAITRSYSSLFDSVKTALNLQFNDLSYENFLGIIVKPEHLGVTPADMHV